MMQQTSSGNRHLHYQATDTCFTKQQTSISIFCRSRPDHAIAPQSTSDKLLGLSSARRGHIDIPSVNQGLNKPGYRPSSICNRWIDIFDHLHIRLQPDHTATLTICNKHRNPVYLLDAMSSRTYRYPSLYFSTALTFITAETTQVLYSNFDSTPMHT